MAPVPHPAATPDDARRLAEAWASALDRSSDAFTPASLEEADRSLSGYHRLMSMGLTTDSLDAGAVDVANHVGCYLGEVIVRNLGGRWVPTAETGYAARPGMAAFPLVVELPNGRCCNPLARPFKLLERGPEGESVAGFYSGMVISARETGG